MTVESDRLAYFSLRLRAMDKLALRTTLQAMELGYREATTPESRAFYEDRIHAAQEEMQRREKEPGIPPSPGLISHEHAPTDGPPDLRYTSCPDCGSNVALHPMSNGGYEERCTGCKAGLGYHAPGRAAS